MMNTKVNELLYALEKLNPQKIEQLRSKFPDNASIFRLGVDFGDADKLTDEELKIKTEISKESNAEMLKRCDVEIPAIKKRIKNYKKINLVAQLITAISSATVITTLLNKPGNYTLTLVFGLLALLASLLPIINEYIITGTGNKKINESFAELIENRIKLEANNRELTYILKSGSYGAKDVSDLINTSNSVTAKIMEILLLA